MLFLNVKHLDTKTGNLSDVAKDGVAKTRFSRPSDESLDVEEHLVGPRNCHQSYPQMSSMESTALQPAGHIGEEPHRSSISAAHGG